MVAMNITFVAVNLVGFSRVFKGAHTYNQVFNGLVQGTILALIFGFVLYEDYFNFYMSLKNRNITGLIFNQFTFAFQMLWIIGAAVHVDTLANYKPPKEWAENVTANCGGIENI